jgi:multidrug efflux pump subunit AcrA (membrane-fusion protein)
MYHDDHAHMVAPGEQTMERRVLVRLPDPTRMQVKAKVSEEKIALVEPGVEASIALEAFPHAQLRGEVVRVSEFPEPESWHGASVKQYQTIVRVDDPLAGMRPGLTADVKLSLQRLDDQLQVPCQAVFRRGEQDYCISAEGGQWEARPVTLGPTNGKTVVIRSGLAEGEPVVLCAAAHRDDVELPREDGPKAGSSPSCDGLANAETSP